MKIVGIDSFIFRKFDVTPKHTELESPKSIFLFLHKRIMPYTSRFTYAEELPSDAVKVENVRGKVPDELYYSYSQDKFYTRFLDRKGNVKRIRECAPNKKGLVYGRDVDGKGICITAKKFRKAFENEHGGVAVAVDVSDPSSMNEEEEDEALAIIDRVIDELTKLREMIAPKKGLASYETDSQDTQFVKEGID